MLQDLLQPYAQYLLNFQYLLLLVNILLHILFAGAIAQDSGRLHNLGQKPALVSGTTWAFATLLGGVMTAAIYWFIHHSTFTRPTIKRDLL